MAEVTRRRHEAWVKRVAIDIAIALVVVIMVFPLLWTFITSIKARVALYEPLSFFTPTWENYHKALTLHGLPKYLFNSVVVAACTTLLSLAIGMLGAYALARFRIARKNSLAFAILSVRMIPPISLVLPFFLLGQMCGILDTRLVLVLVYLVITVPFVIWMMRGFFEGIPSQVEEAAMVDGCTRFRAFILTVIPLARNGILATGILCFIYAWNEFDYALFLTSFNARTLPTTMMFFQTQQGVMWGEASAVAILASLPVIVLAVVLQRYVVSGLTFGMLKE